MTASVRADDYVFPYITCRNISGPEDDEAGRKFMPVTPLLPRFSISTITRMSASIWWMPGGNKNAPQLSSIKRSAETLHEHPDPIQYIKWRNGHRRSWRCR